MKFMRLFLVLAMLFCLVFSTGCIPVVPDEPDEPVLVKEVYVDIKGWNDDDPDNTYIFYSIKNIGTVDVNYEITFDVKFDGHTDFDVVAESDEILEVGVSITKSVKVECPNENLNCPGWDSIESVSVKSIELEGIIVI